jgi:hypothetical protein
MLRMVSIYALQIDAGRRSRWITPLGAVSRLRRAKSKAPALQGCRDGACPVSTTATKAEAFAEPNVHV